MSQRNATNHTSMSHLGERVVESKTNLQNFFREDWSRLRPLIMQLEEKTWSDEVSAGSFESIDTASTSHQHADDAVLNEPATVQSPVRGDRLSGLAEQIEQRIRASHSVGK